MASTIPNAMFLGGVILLFVFAFVPHVGPRGRRGHATHDCLHDCWQLRKAVLDITTLLEDRIGDLEQALADKDIPIPRGRSAAEREERIRRGKEILESWPMTTAERAERVKRGEGRGDDR